MNLRRRLGRLGAVEAPKVSCTCRPRCWRVQTDMDPKTGKPMPEAEFLAMPILCPRCGGVGGGIKVRVRFDGEVNR
jgi:hypothetical protein